MEGYTGSAMRINWALSDSAQLDPTVDLVAIKNVGPIWGGWQTWRAWATDNVICHDIAQARGLISRGFHSRCNMYVPATAYQDLDRPTGVRLYQGDFHQSVDHPDDIVGMHLAAANSDIVLLVGFNLEPRDLEHDKLAKHKWHNYKNYTKHIIMNNPEVQWVILDHDSKLDADLKGLPNLLFDTMSNVLTQFS